MNKSRAVIRIQSIVRKFQARKLYKEIVEEYFDTICSVRKSMETIIGPPPPPSSKVKAITPKDVNSDLVTFSLEMLKEEEERIEQLIQKKISMSAML